MMTRPNDTNLLACHASRARHFHWPGTTLDRKSRAPRTGDEPHDESGRSTALVEEERNQANSRRDGALRDRGEACIRRDDGRIVEATETARNRSRAVARAVEERLVRGPAAGADGGGFRADGLLGAS